MAAEGSGKITSFFARVSPGLPVVRPDNESNQAEPTSPIFPTTRTSPVKKKSKVSQPAEPGQQRSRSFPLKWLDEYKWLRYDEAENSMWCETCKFFGHEGSWSSGTRNFRTKTIKQHLQSEAHKTAGAGNQPGQKLLTSQIEKDQQKRKKATELALKSVYWMASEELANRKYASIINFLQMLGVEDAISLNRGGNANYTSPDIFNQLLECLSQILQKRLKIALQSSPFVGIGTDESTDRSQEKHIVVIIRYVGKDGQLKTQFLQLEKLENGSALSNFNAIKDVLRKFDIPWEKVVGLGADGASVMSGERTGLRKLVAEKNPFCTYVHCVCHRLQLAVSQASKNIPQMETIGKIVNGVFNYMSHSKRLNEFKDIAAILDSDVLKFKRVFEIRWLSFGESVLAVVKNYEPLLIYLRQEANSGEPTAIGLTHQLTSYISLALLHLTADVLSATNHLNRLFQQRDITFSALRGTLQDCKDILESMQRQNGPFLESFLDELSSDRTNWYRGQEVRVQPEGRGQRQTQVEKFKTVREQFLEAILDNINTRFPHVDLLDAMQIFEPKSYPDERELVGFGNQYLKTLLDFYGTAKTNDDGVHFDQPIDPDVVRAEFLVFKRLVYRNRRGEDGSFNSPPELFQKLFNGHDTQGNRAIFHETFKLMSICLCIMVGNAESERVFSCQNRIKSKLRTHLTNKTLDNLIRLSYSDIKAEEFPYSEARDLFLSVKRRL